MSKQSVTSRPRSWRWLAALAGLAGLLVPAAAHGATTLIELSTQTHGQPARLEVGNDLVVRAPHLAPLTVVEVVLREQHGSPVASAHLLANEQGVTAPHLLWRRTGIIGCDPCQQVETPLEFYSHADAHDNLVGRRLILDLNGANGGLLASRTVDLALPSTVQFFYSDGYGCLRGAYGLNETIFLGVWAPTPSPSFRVFFTQDRPVWTVPGAGFSDARLPLWADGQPMAGVSAGLTVLPIWHGADTLPGSYAAIVRFGPGPADSRLLTDDLLLTDGLGYDRSVEAGLRINDWDGGCPPPPPHYPIQCGPPRQGVTER